MSAVKHPSSSGLVHSIWVTKQLPVHYLLQGTYSHPFLLPNLRGSCLLPGALPSFSSLQKLPLPQPQKTRCQRASEGELSQTESTRPPLPQPTLQSTTPLTPRQSLGFNSRNPIIRSGPAEMVIAYVNTSLTVNSWVHGLPAETSNSVRVKFDLLGMRKGQVSSHIRSPPTLICKVTQRFLSNKYPSPHQGLADPMRT